VQDAAAAGNYLSALEAAVAAASDVVLDVGTPSDLESVC
jgi:hypothetical protein